MGSEVSTAFILGTGSRRLTSYRLVATAMDKAWADAQAAGYTRLVVVHGAARGADSLIARWVTEQKNPAITQLPFPADWAAACRSGCRAGHRVQRASGGDYCPAEGAYRNQRMVDHVKATAEPGAAMVLGFFADLAPSAGTADCLKRAEAAGIPARVHHETTMASRA